MTLRTQIFIAMLTGAVLGAAARLPAFAALDRLVVTLTPIGTLFIRLIGMVVVPLVIASLFVGVAARGDVRRRGRIGGKTLAWFLATTFVAAVIGCLVAMLAGFGPGGDASANANGPLIPATPGVIETLIGLVPQNPFAAAVQGELLPLIFVTCLFAAAATVIDGPDKRIVIDFFTGINSIAMVVIGWLMRAAPLAVLILIAGVVARSGAAVLAALLAFALVAIGAMILHIAVVLIPALRFGARLDVPGFFRRISDAVILGFSTASSSAALPVSMAAAEHRIGVSNQVAAFVLPLGATANKNGSAVYKAVTAVFLLHWYGAQVGPTQIVAIILTATAAAFAGAGVPGSSLVTTLIVLNAVGLGPHAAAGIALVTAIDRPLDMCRTAVNTIGNLVGAAWIARSEGEPLRSA